MATTQDIKRGATIELNNEFYTVIDFQHVKLGRGGAFVRTKLKNLHTGAVTERTWKAGEKIETAKLEEKSTQYIYKNGSLYYFMDQNTYEQTSLEEKSLGGVLKYLKEGMIVKVLSARGKMIGIKLPIFCELKVVSTEPSIKGARAAGGLKPATLETGAIINVPLFISPDENVKVDTRTDEYIERVK